MKNFVKENKYIVIVLVLFIVIVSIVSLIWNRRFSVIEDRPFSSSRINILFAGYDSTMFSHPRADTIILGSIDLEEKGIGLLFIPRDTRVEVPGHGKDRINASRAYGGIDLLKETVENFLDVPVDYYVETDFKGFVRIIDSIGGVEIDIEKPLNYVDEAGGVYIDLPAGETQLDGEKALQYVRYREKTMGDIGRVERQRKFINALVEEVLRPNIVVKLPGIFKEVRNSVETDIPVRDITPFMNFFQDLNYDQIKTEMVPGVPEYIGGASYWIANEEEVEIVVNNLVRSKEYIDNNRYHLSIYNGSGEAGVAGNLASRLRKYGFRIDTIDNADHFDYDTSLIKYYCDEDKNTAVEIKNLIEGKVEYIEEVDGNFAENIKIIIGEDYEIN